MAAPPITIRKREHVTELFVRAAENVLYPRERREVPLGKLTRVQDAELA